MGKLIGNGRVVGSNLSYKLMMPKTGATDIYIYDVEHWHCATKERQLAITEVFPQIPIITPSYLLLRKTR